MNENRPPIRHAFNVDGKKIVEICSEVISHEMVLFPAVSR